MARVVVDRSALKTLRIALSGADNKKLTVGWLESAKYDDSTPVAGIAALHEYGSAKGGIPPRPFIRPAIENEQENWDELIKKGFTAVIEGKASVEQVLNALGLKSSADIKNYIINGSHTALSPITIALRKLDNEGVKISGATVGAVAKAIKEGKTGSGELGDQSFGNKDPLRDSGYMIATITHEVSDK